MKRACGLDIKPVTDTPLPGFFQPIPVGAFTPENLQPYPARLLKAVGGYQAGTHCQAMRIDDRLAIGFGTTGHFLVISSYAQEGVDFEYIQ